MKRSFVIPSVIILLSFLFIVMFIITGRTNMSKIQTISDLKETPKLLFTSSWGGYDTKADSLDEILNDFRVDFNDVEVVNQSMAGEDFLFTLKTDFATGNDPDVFGLWPGSDVELLIEQGRVADLTQVLLDDPDWSQQFHANTWQYVTYNEKIYGLPFEIIYEALFINKDMFDKYGVKVPTTYNELVDAVVTFRENDITPIAFNLTPEGSFFYQNLVMKIGGKNEVENPFTEDLQLQPSFIEGMYKMKELYDLGAFPENALYIDDKTRNDMFINKEAAMIVQGSWFIGEQGVNPKDESVDIVRFPIVEGGRGLVNDIIYGCGNGIFHISQKAWDDPVKREESLALLKHLTSVKSAIKFQQSGGFISNIKIPEYSYEPSYLALKGNELLANGYYYIGPTDSFIDRVIWERIIVANFHKLLNGDLTPEEISALVTAEMEGKTP